MTPGSELIPAAVTSARGARAGLVDAMALLQVDGATDEHRAAATELSKAIGRLFAAETGGTSEVYDALADAMDGLTAVHRRLQAGQDRDPVLAEAATTIARTLTILHPPRAELERALRGPGRGDEPTAPVPLAKLRFERLPSTRPKKPRLELVVDDEEDEDDERRGEDRTEVSADIGFQSETNFFAGFTGDLSDGGLFVATWDVLPVGTELTLSFVLPGGHHVTARAKVRWIREPQDDNPEFHPGMGVSFEELAPDHAEAIRIYMARREPLFFG